MVSCDELWRKGTEGAGEPGVQGMERKPCVGGELGPAPTQPEALLPQLGPQGPQALRHCSGGGLRPSTMSASKGSGLGRSLGSQARQTSLGSKPGSTTSYKYSLTWN